VGDDGPRLVWGRNVGPWNAGEAGGGSWDRNTSPRVDRHPTQVKFKWEISNAEDG
jgi:hypothetical protein